MPQTGHRLALVLLSTLILGAAAPLAVAWARLLPAEREPFSRPGEPQAPRERDGWAMFLLCLVTLSYALRLPGVPLESLRPWLDARFPAPWPDYVFLSAAFLLVFAPAFAACYALLRPNPLRVPLILAGVLVLLFWLAAPYLLVEWLGHA